MVICDKENRTKLPPCLCTLDTLRLRQNCRHFADDIFKCILFNGNTRTSLDILLKIFWKFRINNIPSLVQIMAWYEIGLYQSSRPLCACTHGSALPWWRHQMETFDGMGIHRSPVNFPHKGQWRGALMFSLICARINGWVNTREAGDLRCHPAHHDVTVMTLWAFVKLQRKTFIEVLRKIRCYHSRKRHWVS